MAALACRATRWCLRAVRLGVLVAVSLAVPAGAAPGHMDRSPALQGDLAQGAAARVVAATHFSASDRQRASAADTAPMWCGKALKRDDTRHAVFRRARTIKLIYAYPRGRPDRLRYFARLLQADAGVIDSFVAQQSGGRKTVRFDMGTTCGAQYLDIQLLALRHRARAYMDVEGGQLVPTVDAGSVLQREVARATRGERKHNFLVYVDGLNHVFPGDPPTAWGMTDVLVDDTRPGPANASNRPGRIAAIFGPDGAPPPLRPDGFASRMILHELLHTIGAVQDGAPDSTGAGHCTDGADVMCYADGGPKSPGYSGAFCPALASTIGEVLDCSRDDYFSPAPTPGSWLAGHWNTYDSLFLASCADPRLRRDCESAADTGQAAPGAKAAQTPASQTPSPETLVRPIVGGGGELGTVMLALSIGAGEAIATVSSRDLTLPPGLYDIHMCIDVLQPPSAPWASCWRQAAGSAAAATMAQSVTVGRPYTTGTVVTATLDVQTTGAATQTLASSDNAGQPLSLAVPPRTDGAP